MSLLTLTGVTAVRGGRRVFADIDLVLPPGGACIVSGPNGAGKTTLLRVAAGLLAPAAGLVERTGAVAWLGEAAALDEEQPLAAALMLWARIDGAGDEGSVSAALCAMGLEELAEVPIRFLSTGQRRRAALARVIASGAPLWLLDEPVSGLDTVAPNAIGSGDRGASRRRRRGAGGDASAARPAGCGGSAAGMSGFAIIVLRDVRRAWAGGGALLPVAFFLLVATLFPLAVGPDTALLARVGGGIIWTAALLAALLPVERLVGPDLAAGVIDQLLVRGWRPGTVALAKWVAHWLSFGPPLLIAAVPAAGLFGMPGEALAELELGLAIGTPALAALAVAAGALTTGLRGAGALAGLLVLPLAIPLLIFGAGALAGGMGAVKLLAAVSLLICAGAPLGGRRCDQVCWRVAGAATAKPPPSIGSALPPVGRPRRGPAC